MTSIDILTYAFLKQELVNTPESDEVKDLRHSFPKLIEFTENIEKCLEKKNTKTLCFDSTELIEWLKTSHKQVKMT